MHLRKYRQKSIFLYRVSMLCDIAKGVFYEWPQSWRFSSYERTKQHEEVGNT